MATDFTAPLRSSLDAFADRRTARALEQLFQEFFDLVDEFNALIALGHPAAMVQNEVVTNTVAATVAFTRIGAACPLTVAQLKQHSVIKCYFSGRIAVHGGDTFTIQLLIGGVAVGGFVGANSLQPGDVTGVYICGNLRSTIRDATLDATTLMQGGGDFVSQNGLSAATFLFGADGSGSANLSADTSIGLFIKWSSANAVNTISVTDLLWEIGAP